MKIVYNAPCILNNIQRSIISQDIAFVHPVCPHSPVQHIDYCLITLIGPCSLKFYLSNKYSNRDTSENFKPITLDSPTLHLCFCISGSVKEGKTFLNYFILYIFLFRPHASLGLTEHLLIFLNSWHLSGTCILFCYDYSIWRCSRIFRLSETAPTLIWKSTLDKCLIYMT